MLNQVLKVSSWTCQQSVEVLSKSVTFLDFRLSQGSVAAYCRWGGNLCGMYIENFCANHLVKKFWKSVHICESYYQTSSGLLFHGIITEIDVKLNKWQYAMKSDLENEVNEEKDLKKLYYHHGSNPRPIAPYTTELCGQSLGVVYSCNIS